MSFAVCEEPKADSWGSSPWDRPHVGLEGERLAWEALRKAGWRLLGQRVRVAGIEIDLLLRKRSRLVILEVKTRRGAGARPEESISPRQFTRLQQAAAALVARSAAALPTAVLAALPRRIAGVEVWLAACHLAGSPGGGHELRFFRFGRDGCR